MKTYINYFVSLYFILVTVSCTENFLGPEGGDSPTELFEQLWNDYDQHYSRFITKGVNWDSLYMEYAFRISNNTSNRELFDHLSELLSNLKDSHVILETDFDLYVYNKYKPSNFSLGKIKVNYLGSIQL